MIPFPGESLGLFYAWSTVDGDATLGGDIHYRGGETSAFPGYQTLPAGEQWRVWVSPGGGDYLQEPGLDLDIAWVVEVDSGTLTVSASEGIDGDYGDPAATAPTSLGTHSITGPGTLVIPSGFTSTEVWGDADGAFMLVLDATAGSAVVSQVKLRAWPAAGVAGGWSDLNPAFDTTPAAPGRTTHLQIVQYLVDVEDASPTGAWDTAKAGYHSQVAAVSGVTTRSFGTAPGSVLGVTASTEVGGGGLALYTAFLQSTARLVMLTGADGSALLPIDTGPFDEGEEWIRPPSEVSGDYAHYVLRDDEPATRWTGDIVVSIAGDVPGGATLAVQGGQWDDLTPGSSTSYDLGFTHATATAPGSVAVPDLVPMVLIELSHTIATGSADDYPGYPSQAATAAGVSASTVQTFVTMPPYRYWSPTAVIVRKVRQFHRDDGLGVAPPRAFGGASRIRTGRAYGYD